MKNLLLLVGIILLFSCGDLSNYSDNDPSPDPISDDDTSSNSIIVDLAFNLDSEGTTVDDSARALNDVNINGMKVSFRSSDIEFWASDGNFSNLASFKYFGTMENNEFNISSEINLSDTQDNVVFMPNNIKIGDDYTLPSIDINAVYDVARLDIGGGGMNFSKDANSMSLSNDGSLNCNSIIMINRENMTEIHYVPRPLMYDIRANNNADFGTDTNFLNDFVKSNDSMDMDGALFIPFDPVDIKGNGNISKVKIKVKWDMDDLFSAFENNVYTLKNDADGTPFDFEFIVSLH